MFVGASKVIVSVSPAPKTSSPLSGSARAAVAMSGARTPAWPLMLMPPDAIGEVRAVLRSLPSVERVDENSPPHRQRAAWRRSSSERVCEREEKEAKPLPWSVTSVPPRLGPPSGLTDEKTVGCT